MIANQPRLNECRKKSRFRGYLLGGLRAAGYIETIFDLVRRQSFPPADLKA
jgi:hypothetical protein